MLVNIYENIYNNPIRISEIFSDRSVRKSQNKQLNRAEKDVVWFGEIQYNTDKGSCHFASFLQEGAKCMSTSENFLMKPKHSVQGVAYFYEVFKIFINKLIFTIETLEQDVPDICVGNISSRIAIFKIF